MVVLWICLGILVLVAGLITVAFFRSCRRDSGEEPPQIFGDHRIEILWTVIPFLLLVCVFYLTAKTMHVSDPQEHQDPDLIVIGHQWWWEVRYPKSGIVSANEIHIPTGQRLFVKLESADVIHSFWVHGAVLGLARGGGSRWPLQRRLFRILWHAARLDAVLRGCPVPG